MRWVGTISWSLQIGQEEEWFIQRILLRQIQHCSVQTNEYWNLDQGWNAPGQWIHFILLINLGDFLVHHLWVGLIFGLQSLDGWLECLLHSAIKESR